MNKNWKITSILMCCAFACLVVPAIADAKGNFNDLVAIGLQNTNSSSFRNYNVNAQESDVYVPPNYGVPESQHGSGTR